MSRRRYSQGMDNEGAWLDGKLVWRNPTPGNWTNLNLVQNGGQVWVNGELVYDAEEAEANPPRETRPGGDAKLLQRGRLSKWTLTLSNLIALWPVFCSVHQSDALLLCLACCLSILHHAAEMRYYTPSLVWFSPRVRWWLLKGDQAGAVVAILGLGSIELLRRDSYIVAVALSFMLGSEIVMYIPTLPLEFQIEVRTALHTTWHFLSLGLIAYLAVTTHAGEERLYQTLFAALLQ